VLALHNEPVNPHAGETTTYALVYYRQANRMPRPTPRAYGYGSLYELRASWDIFLGKRTSGRFSLAAAVMVRYMPNDEVSSLQVCAGSHLVVWQTPIPFP
jgi:hypothetical protein